MSRAGFFFTFKNFVSYLDFQKKERTIQKETEVEFIEFKPDCFVSRDILFLANRNSENRNKDLLVPYLNNYYLEQLKFNLQSDIFENRFKNSELTFHLPLLKDKFDYPEHFHIKKYENKRQWYWLEDKETMFSFRIIADDGNIDYVDATDIGGVVLCFRIIKTIDERLNQINRLVGDNWKWT